MSTLVAVQTSYRLGSNSTALLRAAAGAAERAGADVEIVDLTKTKIAPCRACDACAATGRCRFTDDGLMDLVDMMWDAGRVLVATPVYYMAAPAQLKALIDRTQCLYNRKYVMKQRLPKEDLARRRGGVIAVAGSRLNNAFDGLELTMKYFFDSLQMTFGEKLYAHHVERPGEIEERPDLINLIEEARELGRRLVTEPS